MCVSCCCHGDSHGAVVVYCQITVWTSSLREGVGRRLLYSGMRFGLPDGLEPAVRPEPWARTKHLPRAASRAGGWHSRQVLRSLHLAQCSGQGSQRWFMKTEPASKSWRVGSCQRLPGSRHWYFISSTGLLSSRSRSLVFRREQDLAPPLHLLHCLPTQPEHLPTQLQLLVMEYFLCINICSAGEGRR